MTYIKSLDIEGERKFVRNFLLLLLTYTIYDLFSDYFLGIAVIHLLQEAIIFLGALFLFLFSQIRSHAHNAKIFSLQEELDKSSLDFQKLRGDFSEMVDKTFSNWVLTKSEIDIANYLLKGCSMQEIAGFRKTSERTVRHQSGIIYKKANVASRKELVSSFIEDLL